MEGGSSGGGQAGVGVAPTTVAAQFPLPGSVQTTTTTAAFHYGGVVHTTNTRAAPGADYGGAQQLHSSPPVHSSMMYNAQQFAPADTSGSSMQHGASVTYTAAASRGESPVPTGSCAKKPKQGS